MKKTIILSLAVCLLPAFAAHAKKNDCNTRKNPPSGEVTLQQVIELGLCRNPNTAAAYLSAESARLSKNAAYAPYLPSVNASVDGTKRLRNKEWSDWQSGASLSASWLLFDFGKRLADLNAMAAMWRATGFDYSNTVQNFVYEMVAAYYGMLGADAEVRVAEYLVDVARGARDTASKKHSAGSVARADVLRADTTLALRELELQRANGNREIAKGRLLYLLSFTQDQELKIADMPAQFGSQNESKAIEDLIERARRQRPDLLSAGESKNAAWHRRNSAFLRNLPSISASGTLYYDFNNNYDDFGAGPNDRMGASIGLRASMPIFAGFANAYNLRASQANYERSDEQMRARDDNVQMDVWTAFQNYQTAQKVLVQSEALLKSATESERVVAGMYRVGRATMLDWQTQQADLASAQRQNITAKYDLFVRRAALALAAGELTEALESE
ncbi:MAG: TolC family protein [Alphaproteobacteria bacterium]|nr:TolC family protein [Alphaproteobacteria bacterium]MCL2889894.1 TolC family protein [Alphaproteobacteria bacterium]